MPECRGALVYGVIAPSNFWLYVGEQLACLLFGEVAAASVLFLLVQLRPSILHPQTLRQRYRGGFHFALLLVLAGGASWRLSFIRRQQYKDAFWCRLSLMERGPVHSDVFSQIWLCLEVFYPLLFALIAGPLTLNFVWYLLQTTRNYFSTIPPGHKNVFRVLRKSLLGVPIDQSFPVNLTRAEICFPIFQLLLLSAGMVSPLPWLGKLDWQVTVIVTSITQTLCFWVHDRVVKRLKHDSVRAAIKLLAYTSSTAVAYIPLLAMVGPFSFPEGLGLVFCLIGIIRVVVEFLPSSEELELPTGKSGDGKQATMK